MVLSPNAGFIHELRRLNDADYLLWIFATAWLSSVRSESNGSLVNVLYAKTSPTDNRAGVDCWVLNRIHNYIFLEAAARVLDHVGALKKNLFLCLARDLCPI